MRDREDILENEMDNLDNGYEVERYTLIELLTDIRELLISIDNTLLSIKPA